MAKPNLAATVICGIAILGCSHSDNLQPAAQQQAANGASAPLLSPDAGSAAPSDAPAAESESEPDCHFMLDRLREVVQRDGLEGWSIARSPITWSTLTVDCGEKLTTESADLVWSKWTEPVTALTLPVNQDIRHEIETAVAKAAEAREGKSRFDSKGFRFAINAQNGGTADTTFVRISFMGTKYARE